MEANSRDAVAIVLARALKNPPFRRVINTGDNRSWLGDLPRQSGRQFGLCLIFKKNDGATDGTRTHNNQNHNLGLYH